MVELLVNLGAEFFSSDLFLEYLSVSVGLMFVSISCNLVYKLLKGI